MTESTGMSANAMTSPDARATIGFAVIGNTAQLDAAAKSRLFDRAPSADPAVRRIAEGVIDDVRLRGDAALRELAERFDGVALDELEVPRTKCVRALETIPADVRTALEQAAANIAVFHRAQLPEPVIEIETTNGVRLGRRAEPLRSVGVYAPGGRAAYPSSVLMGVVPARVAGVADVLVCSPPGPDGTPPQAVLAACAIAGVDRVFAIGGAGAIAALAFGTTSVPRVDRIVGPGNAYVTEAKRQVTGLVSIDSPAGPSEVLVIADETADPALAAIELVAQAEHDPDAAAVLVTTHTPLIDAVRDLIDDILADQPRADIIRAALSARGALLAADSIDHAVSFAARYAPEHLLVMTRDPRALLPRLRAAGTIFLGSASSVVFGDYITGANHVLPTGGSSRSYSGLSTLDFMRWTTYQEVTPDAAVRIASPTVTLATAEGLPAHTMAATMRDSADATMRNSDGTIRDPVGVTMRPALPPLRADYRTIIPYDPGRTPCAIDLSDNTNLFGPAPSVRDVLRNAPDAVVTRYPSVYSTDLKRALAALHDVEPGSITTGCGSDDVIDSALRAFYETGAAIAYPDPTFGVIPMFGRMNGLRTIPVPLSPALELDVDGLIRSRARIIYICRPNNPTGTVFARDGIERLLEHAEGIVLIDEAYADFSDNDLIDAVMNSENAVILRTMSKAYGLAGLRVGYAIGPQRLVAEIEKSRGPYKVSGMAEAAALSVLSRDMDWVRDRIIDVRANRARLLRELLQRDLAPLDSAANFVLLPISGRASTWNTALRARGVAVRPFTALPHLGDCLRISIGPWDMIERVLAAFDDVQTEARP